MGFIHCPKLLWYIFTSGQINLKEVKYLAGHDPKTWMIILNSQIKLESMPLFNVF